MYANLKTIMGIENVPLATLAEELNAHLNSIRNKINGSSEFTLEEARIIWERHFQQYNFWWVFKKLKPLKDSA